MSGKVDILLVDDRPEGLLALEAVLSSPEYNLITAASGHEALARAAERDFAVILLDVQMPVLDGFETALLLRRLEGCRNVPIIFVTAISKEDRYIYKGYQAGAVDYLFKPYDPYILQSKVAVFVSLFQKNREIERQAELLRKEVAERRRVQAELAKARDMAVESARVKSEFVANVSHEIRTPMNGIIGMAGLLLDTPLDEKQRRFAEAVRVSGDVLLDLINNILDFSKIEAGKMVIRRQDFSLEAMMQSTMSLFSLQAQDKGVEISSRIEEDVPRTLCGDEARLRQVVMNLLGNAVKFTEKGEIRLLARKTSEADGRAVLRLEVQDTGIGISPENQKLLFQAFSQVDTSMTRKYHGTGLGLVISRQLVHMMGGRIGVQSEPGKGSSFWCEIPFEVPTGSETLSAAGPGRAPAKEFRPHLGHLQVLLVEDNVISREVVLHQLQKAGVKAVSAGNGREALKAMESYPYDLVLMDCQMPEMDGYAATAAVRRKEAGKSRVPIVAMTANAMEGDRERCLAAGMDDYIAKPVRMEDLLAVLSKWDVALDPAALARLKGLDGDGAEDIRGELIDLFIKETPGKFVDMRRALDASDAEALQNIAHALKGSCGYLGANRMRTLCARIELAASSGLPGNAAELIKSLEEDYESVLSSLTAEYGRKALAGRGPAC